MVYSVGAEEVPFTRVFCRVSDVVLLRRMTWSGIPKSFLYTLNTVLKGVYSCPYCSKSQGVGCKEDVLWCDWAVLYPETREPFKPCIQHTILQPVRLHHCTVGVHPSGIFLEYLLIPYHQEVPGPLVHCRWSTHPSLKDLFCRSSSGRPFPGTSLCCVLSLWLQVTSYIYHRSVICMWTFIWWKVHIVL